MNNEFNNLQGTNSNEGMNISNNQIPLNNKKKNNLLYIIIAIVAVVVLVITIFIFMNRGKTLNCTMNQDISGMNLSSDLEIVYRGKKAKSMNLEMVYDLKEYATYKDQVLTELDKQLGDKLDELNKNGGKASIKSDDSTITIKVSASKSGLSTMFSVNDDYTYDEVKSQFEELGYTCK